MLDVRHCTLAEITGAPNLPEVLAEYALESSLPELGPASAQFDTYHKLDANGVLYPIGAFEGDRLVGFILIIVAELPHYGVRAATAESFFVPLADRKKGVGLRLLKLAEDLAASQGAYALLLSAPVGGVLERVLPGRQYRHSNNVFVKALA